MKAHIWIQWIGAVFVSTVTLAAGAFEVFETKDQAKIIYEVISARLERIENKVDRILDHRR